MVGGINPWVHGHVECFNILRVMYQYRVLCVGDTNVDRALLEYILTMVHKHEMIALGLAV